MSHETNPSLIARETLRRLVIQKSPPTPENYQKMYEKIAGITSSRMGAGTVKLLSELVRELPRNAPQLCNLADTLNQAINDNNWLKYKTTLIDLVNHNLSVTKEVTNKQQHKPADYENFAWGETISTLVKQLEVNHGRLTLAKKREGLNRVLTKFRQNPALLHDKLLALVDSWKLLASEPNQSIEIETNDTWPLASEINPAASLADPMSTNTLPENMFSDGTLQFQQLLAQILSHIAAMPLGDSGLTDEAEYLAKQVNVINNQQELEQFVSRFKQFGRQLESYAKNGDLLLQRLLHLFYLLMDRTGELLSEDQWLQGQIALLRETLSSQLNLQVIEKAEHQLTKIIQKHDIISQSLDATKTTLKRMVTCLVDNIETLSNSTGEYHDKIEHFSTKINQTEDIAELHQLLEEIMAETKNVQRRMQDSQKDFLAARAEVDAAQSKIHQLESELQQMGEKVLEDHLTGILNRRGLDNAFARESSRAKRLQKPLSLAILDIDNFKKLNDTYGHKVGDDALVYLVEAIQETTRPDDIVARFGGEEFVILLPDTNSEQAVIAVTRVRRSLTKRLFLHDNKRLFITFSAGVAEYQLGETQDSIITRADEALYRAKKNGKNQVIAA